MEQSRPLSVRTPRTSAGVALARRRALRADRGSSEQLTEETIRFIEEIERVAAAPVSLISTRFHTRSIIDRRAW